MATRVTPPPLTIDIAAATTQLKNGSILPPPQTAALTGGNGAGSPGSPGLFHPKKQYQYHQHPYHHLQRADGPTPSTPHAAAAPTESSYWASPTSVSTTTTFTPVPFSAKTGQDLQKAFSDERGEGGLEDRSGAHRQSDGAFHRAIKVDSIYQQLPLQSQQQQMFPKQQAYLQKFNAYTAGSRFGRQGSLTGPLMEPTTTMAALSAIEHENHQRAVNKLEGYQFPPAPLPGSTGGHGRYASIEGDHHHHHRRHHPLDHVESPGSPMSMTCPPPYQGGGGMYGLERSSSMEKLALASMTQIARPRMARLSSSHSVQMGGTDLPPMAIPISTESEHDMLYPSSPPPPASPPASVSPPPPASASSLPCALGDRFKDSGVTDMDDETKASQQKRTSRIIGADSESLYNLRVSEDSMEAPKIMVPHGSQADTAVVGMGSSILPRYSRNQITPSLASGRPKDSEAMMGSVVMATPSTTTGYVGIGQEPQPVVQFPSFWQDAKQHHMHWTFFSMGAIWLASGAWIATMQVFAPWVIVLPIVTLSVLGLQYGHYRWKRAKFQKRQREECHRRQRATTILFSDRPRRHGPWLHDLDAAAPSPRPSLPPGVGPAVLPTLTVGGPSDSDDQPSPAYTPRVSSSQEHASSISAASAAEAPSSTQPPQPPQPQWPSMMAPMRQNQQFLTVETSSSLALLHHHHHQTPQTPPPAYCLKRVELPEMDLGENLTLSFDVNRFSM